MKKTAKQVDISEEGIQYVEKQDLSNLETFLDTSGMDELYPFSFEELPDRIESGNNYIRILLITDYPKRAYGNWLSELKRKKGNISIVQFMENASSNKMVKFYNDTIKNKRAELLKTYDPLKKKEIQNQIDKADMQLENYIQNRSTFITQYTYIYLQEESKEALDNLTASVTGTLIKLQLKYMTPTKAMIQAFWSSLPLQENLLEEYTYKQSNTETASSMFPFDDSEILELSPRSDVEGINKDTDSLIAIDYLNKRTTLNQNMVVIGTSGVGKTTYMIQKILKYVAKGIKVFIIDPENEYSDIVELLGGPVVHLSSNAKTKINPLEIFSDIISDDQNETEDIDIEEVVKDKITRVKGFCQVLKPDMTQVEKALIDKILRETYRSSGILRYRSIHEIKSEQYPTLSNFYDEIQKLETNDPKRFAKLEDFFYILEGYVSGSTTLFNGVTNINLHTNLLSFDLKSLQNEPDVQGACYLNTFSYLWDEITKNKTENIKLIVDEFHFLTQNPDASSFFFQAYKRFRKYNAGAIAGTQQLEDVLKAKTTDGTNLGQAIVGNAFTKVFFGLDDMGVEDLSQRLKVRFSDKEQKLLKKKKQGEALIIHGSQRAFMKITLTPEELYLIDREQYEETYSTGEPINYEELISMTPQEIEEAENFIY